MNRSFLETGIIWHHYWILLDAKHYAVQETTYADGFQSWQPSRNGLLYCLWVSIGKSIPSSFVTISATTISNKCEALSKMRHQKVYRLPDSPDVENMILLSFSTYNPEYIHPDICLNHPKPACLRARSTVFFADQLPIFPICSKASIIRNHGYIKT